MSIRRLKSRGIGRLELLAWVNEFLETDYSKIEHLADGIAYCQIFDALHPGKVNLQQVRFHARGEPDYERNFAVLRRAFHSCGVAKEIPMRNLVQGVFQEHFEFLHWVHDYAHKTYPDAQRQYHGLARRQQVLGSPLNLADMTGKTNMNLVPSYTTSSKLQADAYQPEYLTLRDDLVVDACEDADLDISRLAEMDFWPPDLPPTPQPCPREQSAPKPLDPFLILANESVGPTMQAKQMLTQFERTMQLVMQDKTTPHASQKKASKVGAAPSTASKRSARSTQKPSRACSLEPPFLAPQLNDVIDVLAAELSGRALDLCHLDEMIATLLRDVEEDTKTMASDVLVHGSPAKQPSQADTTAPREAGES